MQIPLSRGLNSVYHWHHYYYVQHSHVSVNPTKNCIFIFSVGKESQNGNWNFSLRLFCWRGDIGRIRNIPSSSPTAAPILSGPILLAKFVFAILTINIQTILWLIMTASVQIWTLFWITFSLIPSFSKLHQSFSYSTSDHRSLIRQVVTLFFHWLLFSPPYFVQHDSTVTWDSALYHIFMDTLLIFYEVNNLNFSQFDSMLTSVST